MAWSKIVGFEVSPVTDNSSAVTGTVATEPNVNVAGSRVTFTA